MDNAGKPLTSNDGYGTIHVIEGAGPGRTRVGQTLDKSFGQSELVIGLDTVSTPAAPSTALSKALQRAGTQEAFSGKERDDLLLMLVMRWIDGEDLPDSWSHLEALVRAMGASDREVEAFRQAYARITSYTSAPDPDHDLADLVRTALRMRNLSIAVLGPCTIATLATGYTAGLQADPVPGLGKLVGFGALFLFGCVLVLRAIASLIMPLAKAEQRFRYKRPAASGCGSACWGCCTDR